MCAEPNTQGRDPVLEDGELMSRLAAGDMGALEAVYMKYGAMTRAAIRRTDPRISAEDAEELTQEVFLSLVKSAANFDPARALKPWLYGIAVHAAAGRRRTGFRHLRLLEKHHNETRVTAPPLHAGALEQLDARQQLRQAFAALSKDQAEVMVLHAVEGFSGEEIAQILGVEVNTIWTRLHRARRLLTGILRSTREETP